MTVEEFEEWLQRATWKSPTGPEERGYSWKISVSRPSRQQKKALKALLIYLSDDYPRVHAFTLLVERLEQHVAVPEPIREVVELSDYAVQIRYPGDYYPVSEEEYERALDLAERVLRWVRSQIGQEMGGL